jgi:RHS repeat-associated protein
MVYSEVTRHDDRSLVRSAYAYDALGRRTLVQDAGHDTMRTLYDGTGFEAVREGTVFSDGRFTTRYSEGVQALTNPGTEGSRYRWIGEAPVDARTRIIEEGGEYGEGRGRYTGVSVTLYGRGEAVSISRSAGSGYRGGTTYLGKDLQGSVRSATDENGLLEDLYEYDAFGKPYKGDLTQGMNLGYTGKPYDTATGMYNYGYRDYTPEAARFTTVDPVRDGTNWFTYVNNDPVNYTDPWGLEIYSAGDIATHEAATISFLNGVLSSPGSYTVNSYSRDAFIGAPNKMTNAITVHSFYTFTNDNGKVTTISFNGTTYSLSSTGAWISNTRADVDSYINKKNWDTVNITPENGIDTVKTAQNIKDSISSDKTYYALDHLADKENAENCNTALQNTQAAKKGS